LREHGLPTATVATVNKPVLAGILTPRPAYL